MKRLWWIVAFLGIAALAQNAVGGWGYGVVMAAGCGWWAFSTYRWFKGWRASGSSADPALDGLPGPPSRAEYKAAGVDMNLCTKCRKPLKTMGYFFGRSGFPTVYCPSCWSKATMQEDMEKFHLFYDSLTTKYDRREL
jgi:hypothetical protein